MYAISPNQSPVGEDKERRDVYVVLTVYPFIIRGGIYQILIL